MRNAGRPPAVTPAWKRLDMGVLDLITGVKRPRSGVAPKSPEAVRAAILAINRVTAPFQVRDGKPKECDLVAEWRIVDAAWREIFAKAGLASAHSILMRLDMERQEVRATDRQWSVEWRAGIPALALTAEGFRGRRAEVSFGAAYAFTETGRGGVAYHYRFATSELKKPLQAAVTGAGWTWRPVAFARL